MGYSYTSPTTGNRGCLCPNGTYSIKCCTGDLITQGIGVITASEEETLALTFDSIQSAYDLVEDAGNLDVWNHYFDLPVNGNMFTKVKLKDNTVYLYGGSNIVMKDRLFNNVQTLVSVYDNYGAVVTLKIDTFGNCDTLTSVIMKGVTSCINKPFAGNNNLATLQLPLLATCTAGLFTVCPKMEAIDLPLLTSVGTSGFANNTGLKTVNLPLLASSAGSLFSGCTSLELIDLPSIVTITQNTFYNCSALKTISMPIITQIGSNPLSPNGIFTGINGNTITLTIPSDKVNAPDVLYLVANNTVTIIET